MKRLLFFSTAVLCAVLFVLSCDKSSSVKVIGVTLSETNISIVRGTSKTLTAKIVPENADNQNVTWKSANTDIATVDAGTVKGVGVGKTNITVATIEGDFRAICEVTVTSDVVNVTGVTLDKPSLDMVEEDEVQLTATVTPANATDKSVTWESSAPTIATVTNGLVKAVAEGNATITVKTTDGGKTATCAVTVAHKVIHVESVSLDKTELNMSIDDEETLTATVLPATADDKSVTWESSNSNVATVTDGVVKAVDNGEATITVKTKDGGKTATCKVTVAPPTISFTKMAITQLPDMLEPKSDHSVFVANGELVVAGGHTTGFVISSEAEYYSGGSWHTMTMKAPHDFPFGLLLSNGKFMIGGGASSNYGVGASTAVETYDPTTHEFTTFASLVNPRLMGRAIELANGEVVVSGNWYTTNSIEVYKPSDNKFHHMVYTSSNMYQPYVFRIAANQSMAFGPASNQGEVYNGEDFYTETLAAYSSYTPIISAGNQLMDQYLIGNYATDDYRYLILGKSSAGKFGLILINGKTATVVPTDVEIPTTYNNEPLYYAGPIVDRSKNIAYLVGSNSGTTVTFIVVAIDYSKIATTGGKAELKGYYSDPVTNAAPASGSSMTLMPDGQIVLTGGIYNSNYTPFKTVYTLAPWAITP